MLAGTTTIYCTHDQRAYPVLDVSILDLDVLIVDPDALQEPVLLVRREQGDVHGRIEAGQEMFTGLQRLTLYSMNNAAKIRHKVIVCV